MKRKIINSFIILSTSSAITKLFSMLNRILLARILPMEALSLFILVMPSLSMCITLGQLGIPSAIFRLIANPTYQNKKVMITGCIISSISCFFISIGLILFAPYISNSLLHNKEAYLPLVCLAIYIPFIGVSGILKNYFLAKENIYLIAKAQLIEEIMRLLFICVTLVNIQNNDNSILVSIAVMSMIVGELFGIIYMFIRLSNKPKYFFELLPNFKEHLIVKQIMSIALPVTGSRLYHSLVSFLEPIILLSILSSRLSSSQIQYQYAIINGFVLSLLITPTFFNNVIYRIFLPIVTRDVVTNNYKNIHSHLLLALLGSFSISIPFTCLFYFFPETCLSFLYNTTEGASYLQYLSIPFILFYLQTPLSAVIHALNKNKIIFAISFIECSIEIVLTYVLASTYGVFSIAISLLVGTILTLFLSVLTIFYFVYLKSRY
ncbi:oligosaccharide flippase family protein [Tannockella kyphosi]|uniref:oligosaccharide flippase family protein n=1 Tax=Tannockella kyphosi TaxID=2899121 RepID=UPI002012695B|nr:oligosaccharide flippase family protein [Tannockella kyphosi]